jgi:glycerol-3-phosphate acyltransferase PlsY
MTESLLAPLLIVAGYLSGSIPFGLVSAKLFLDIDVREVGSGNIGATNAARAGGAKLGVLVLILDAAKAMLPILVTRHLMEGSPRQELWMMAVAVAAFLGHLFPVWIGFKGGKGVATGLGIFAVLAPWSALAGLLTWVVIYLTTRLSSLGSLAGTLVCAIGVTAIHGPASPLSWAGAATALLVFWRHRENIRRLARGEEGKV